MDICPRCGVLSKKGTLCTQCQREEQGAIPLIETTVKVCEHCQTFFFRNTWSRFKNFQDIERRILGKQSGELKPLFVTCPRCSKTPASNYYEGILQIRNARQDIVAYVHQFATQQQGRGAFLMKSIVVSNGMDFYVANQKLLMKLGKLLLQKFGGIIKTNAKIHTRDVHAGKEVYRMTVLFEAFRFNRHQIVMLDDQVIEVTQLGKQCYGKNLTTGRKLQLKTHMKLSLLKPVKTTVTKIKPRLEVLHPETFQSVPVENQPLVISGHSPVWVVYHDMHIYIVDRKKEDKKT